MAAARPTVSVFKLDGTFDAKGGETVKLPNVLLAPIRNDIVQFVHSNMAKNRRQAYAVKEMAGMQHSAESWGTGRAVARIPRVSGGGSSRAGQAAFGNMCRKGRMFAPTKTWRRWHRKINQNQKRYAVASALAASAIPSLVLARGHRVEEIPELPLVVADEAESVKKTKQAVTLLDNLYAYADVEKSKNSRKLRAGKGKMRNRRHVQRRGPLVVYNEDKGITQAFRNLPGVELAHVDRLNLLQLAPGGHLGRFIVWTKSAFQRLDKVWGSQTRESVQKKGYTLPRPAMAQSDLTRLINSDEIQSKVRPAIRQVKRARTKKNPLKNLGALVTLNPYALALRRSALLTEQRRRAAKAKVLADRKAGKKSAAVVNEHKGLKAKNYARLSGAGTGPGAFDPVVKVVEVAKKKGLPTPAPEDKEEKPVTSVPVAAAAKPAAPAAKPAAAAPAAKPAGKPEKKEEKKDDKKKPEGKKDDKKGGKAGKQ